MAEGMNCVPFPPRDDISVVSYATHGVLVPVLFGIGFIGNLVTVVLCNHGSLRKDNAVFIHVCGLATTNAIVLLCTVPATLQEVEIFPANVTFSRPMAYADMVSYIVGNIAHHASLWLLVTLGFFALHAGRNPYGSSRLIRNSTNRIVVFVCALVCALANFPRFLEVSVREVSGHCFVGMSLWDFELTHFGSQPAFTVIYPWVITGLCHALPLALILVAALLLGQHAGWRRLRTTPVALRTTNDADERHLGLVKAVWIALLAGFSLEMPTLCVRITGHLSGMTSKDNAVMYCAELLANYLSLVQSSIGFFIYTIYCSDFRKALRRTLCCVCSDEFYEPCACCSPAYRRHLKEIRMLDEARERHLPARGRSPRGRPAEITEWSRKPPRVGHHRRAYDGFGLDRNGSAYSTRSVSMTTTSGYPSESAASLTQYAVIGDVSRTDVKQRAPPDGAVSPSPEVAVRNGGVSPDTADDGELPWV